MIKKLFLTATLLAPSLASGGNPSADLSIQIVPAGPAVAVPAGAQAAGFTTLAVNYDFSQPFYAIQSNWLAPYSNGGNPPGNFQWFQTLTCNTVGPTPPPASAISQVFDSAAGTNVLDLHWLGSYYVSPVHSCPNSSTVSIATEEVNRGPRGQDYPQGMYIEAVVRVDRNNNFASTTFGVVQAFWAYGSAHSGYDNNPNAPIERDYQEIFTNPGGSPLQYSNQSILNWGTGTGGNPGAGATQQLLTTLTNSLGSYHKIAARTTSDGTTMETCGYVDDTQIYCNNDHANAGQLNTQRNRIILQCGDVTNDMHCYFQYVRVWSCADWQTTMCNGKVLTGAP